MTMNVPHDPIINLRGTSGSGKTYVAYRLLREHETPEERWELCSPRARAPLAYRVGNLWVVGRYTGRRCSGVDGMVPVGEKITPLVLHYGAQGGPVLIEGLALSTTVSTWVDARARFGDRIVLAYLDTPLERCIERIYERNGGTPIDEQAVRRHFRGVINQGARLKAQGFNVVRIDHQRSYEQVCEILRSGGWTG